jgi:dCTP deaminase
MLASGKELLEIVSRWENFLTTHQRGKDLCSYGLGYAGYDLRLSNQFRIPGLYYVNPGKERSTIHPKGMYATDHGAISLHKYNKTVSPLNPYEHYVDVVVDTDILVLPSYTTILAHSIEKIVVPENYLGICLGKSSYARIGLLVNTTPAEPGWRGNLVIELTNLSPWKIELRIGEGIAQMLFIKLTEKATYQGRWQDQKLPRE